MEVSGTSSAATTPKPSLETGPAGRYIPSPWGNRFHHVRDVARGTAIKELLGAGAAGPGKALDANTLIPTPNGMVKIGDLRPGDLVFDESGTPVEVLGRSDVMTGRKCYRVTFDDGESIVADEDHLWSTLTYNERACFQRRERRDPAAEMWEHVRTRTTGEILETLMHKGRTNHAIPVASAFTARGGGLPIDPYLLGVWLGDGTSRTSEVTTPDPEIVKAFSDGGYEVRHKEGLTYSIKQGFYRRLRLNGLLCNKHIPEQYQLAGWRERQSLLQGLIDTDGHVDRDGRVEFCSCIERLAEGAYRLVCSLGFKATIKESDATLNGRVVGRRWRICFSPMGRDVARLPRRLKKLGAGTRTQRWRYIKSVVEVESRPVCCISVDSPSRLYLAGRAHIPTHNSVVLLRDPLFQMLREKERCLLPEDHPDHLEWGTSQGRALLLRRTTPMLADLIGQFLRIVRYWDPEVKWKGDPHNTATFTCGYVYQFGHCNEIEDWQRYMGAGKTWIGYDELVYFDESQYENINTWLRASDHVLANDLRIRAATNPVFTQPKNGSVKVTDPQWVKKRFVTPCPEGNKILRFRQRFEVDDGDERRSEIIENTRMFMPATLFDNPDATFRATYLAQLAQRPPHIRRALIYGDWDITPGGYFEYVWDPRLHVVDPYRIPIEWPRWRAMDWGHKTQGVILWMAMDPDGNVVVYREFNFRLMTDSKVCDEVERIEASMGLWYKGQSLISGAADTQIWEKRGNNAKSTAEVFMDRGIHWEYAVKERAPNAQAIAKRLGDHGDGTTTPGLTIFRGCRKTIANLPNVQARHDNPEEPLKSPNDHWFECVGYGVRYADRGVHAIQDHEYQRGVLDDEDSDAQADGGRDGYGGA